MIERLDPEIVNNPLSVSPIPETNENERLGPSKSTPERVPINDPDRLFSAIEVFDRRISVGASLIGFTVMVKRPVHEVAPEPSVTK